MLSRKVEVFKREQPHTETIHDGSVGTTSCLILLVISNLLNYPSPNIFLKYSKLRHMIYHKSVSKRIWVATNGDNFP